MADHGDVPASLLVLAAGLIGAAGVAMAAVAAHGAGDVRLAGTSAGMALVHAPAMVALAALPPALARWRTFAGALFAIGVVLFSGDLAARFFTGGRLIADAAPLGGMLLIAGWLVVAIGAAVAMFRRRRVVGGAA